MTPANEKPKTLDEIQERIEIDIRNMVSLPVLPKVYLKIQKLDRDPKSDVRKWAEVIDSDPLSSAMIIRRLHSPIYGFQEEITDTKRAVTLLGKNTVKELIICQSVKRAFKRVHDQGFEVEEFWLHSLAVAVTTRLLGLPLDKGNRTPEQERDFNAYELSESAIERLEQLQLGKCFSLSSKEEPFIAAMMHDIGKVAIVVSYPEMFPEIVQELETQSWQMLMLQAEKNITGGVNHATVGTLLAKHWELSHSITRVTGNHHAPESNDHLSMLIALADFLGGAVFPFPGKAQYPMVERAWEKEGQDYSRAEEMMKDFLPENVLDALNAEPMQLIDLGRALAPTIKRVVEELRKGI